MRSWLLLAAVASCAACQTYDFERVEPHALATHAQVRQVVAHGLLPDVMLTIDVSGSMAEPIEGRRPECQRPDGLACGSERPCPAGCATRLTEVKRAMSDFLLELEGKARVGLTVFPAPTVPDACAAGRIQLDIPRDDGAAQTGPVAAEISRLQPHGGTPTAATLFGLSGVEGLNDPKRDDFVLLVTDGLPNCDANNPADVSTCECTAVKQSPGAACERRACLDSGGAVSSVRELKRRDIRTGVIGFGADTATGIAGQVLNALANEGGMARTCAADLECGPGDRCSQGRCGRAYYQAVNALELDSALRAVTGDIFDRPCQTPLEFPLSDPQLLAVRVDGQSVPRGPDTWSYQAGTVVFVPGSEICARLEASTADHPVRVEIRTAEAL